MSAHTDKQNEVLEQIERLLGEHFDAYVVLTSTSDINDEGDGVTSCAWAGTGGRSMAIGLLEQHAFKLKSEFLSNEGEE